MKYKNTAMLLLGTLALGLSATSFAATDTIDASSGQAGTYFTPTDADKYDSPYYRGFGEDWGWTHNAIGGTITDAVLGISAFDVDHPQEVDRIELYNNDTSSWDFLGDLTGTNDEWEFTEFTLGSSWFDEIGAGLQVRMLISVGTSSGWIVSLAKSQLAYNGGTIGNPNPGQVPVPAALFMFAPALLGFLGLRRKTKTA